MTWKLLFWFILLADCIGNLKGSYWYNRRMYFIMNNIKMYAKLTGKRVKVEVFSDHTTTLTNNLLFINNGGSFCLGLNNNMELTINNDCREFTFSDNKLNSKGYIVCPHENNRKLKLVEECNYSFGVESQATPTISIVASTILDVVSQTSTPVEKSSVLQRTIPSVSLKSPEISLIRKSSVKPSTQLPSEPSTKAAKLTSNMISSKEFTRTLSSVKGQVESTKPTLPPSLISASSTLLIKVPNSTSIVQGPVYGYLGEWTQNDCSENCRISSTSRIRECLHIQNGSESGTQGKEICTERQVQQVRCLNLTGCKGTRNYLADQGMSCHIFCKQKGLVCSENLETGNSPDVFENVVFPFIVDLANKLWKHKYAPYCIEGVCKEYEEVPPSFDCGVDPPMKFQRLCRCEEKEDIGFGDWSPWSECSTTCSGVRIRSRECFGYCHGNYSQEQACEPTKCPVHGGFSQWSVWSNCTVGCGGGTREKERKCDTPRPTLDGKDCIGLKKMTEECNIHPCPVNGRWSNWSVWSACNKPCNNGSFVRTRVCSSPLFGGRHCEGAQEEKKPCNLKPCPETVARMVIPLDMTFSPEFENTSSKNFSDLQELLLKEINETFQNTHETKITIRKLELHSAREGSIIVNFTLYFFAFDSTQFIVMQDSIEIEQSFGKLPIAQDGIFKFEIDGKVPSAPPSNISIHSPVPGSLILSWNPVPFDQNKTIKGYTVFYRLKIDMSAPYARISTEQMFINITALHSGATYNLRLLAYTEDGNGVASNLLEHTIKQTIPSIAPFPIIASSVDPYSVFIEWDSVPSVLTNGAPKGYKIKTFHKNIVIRNSTASYGQNNILISGLTPSTWYTFHVCVYNEEGDGPWNKIGVTTEDSFTTSSYPLNASVSDIKSHDLLTVQWEAPEGNYTEVTSYNILLKNRADKGLLRTEIVHASFRKFTWRNLKANTKYMIEIIAMYEKGEAPPVTVFGETCKCAETVSMSYYKRSPYTFHSDKTNRLGGLFAEILSEMIPFICGSCNRGQNIKQNKTVNINWKQNGRGNFAERSSELQAIREIDEYTDVVYPVVGTRHLDVFTGYPYVPLIEHPGVVLIARDKSVNEVTQHIVKNVFIIWPILIINLLIMIIGGFMVWLWEGGLHKETDFSKKIFTGLQEGFYWAFITLGTLGYGDFTPRHRLSRLFSVLFIMVGLVLSSLLVASIVTAVTTVNDAASVNIYGTEIGALSESFEELIGVLRNGKVNTKKKYKTIKDLREALLCREIEGILLDAYTAGSNKKTFEHPQLRTVQMIRHPRTYGFVLSSELQHAAKEARDYISTNQQLILSIIANSTERMSPREKEPTRLPYEADSIIFQQTIIWLFSLLIAFILLGVLYEKFNHSKNTKVHSLCHELHEKQNEWKELNALIEQFQERFDKKLSSMLNVQSQVLMTSYKELYLKQRNKTSVLKQFKDFVTSSQ